MAAAAPKMVGHPRAGQCACDSYVYILYVHNACPVCTTGGQQHFIRLHVWRCFPLDVFAQALSYAPSPVLCMLLRSSIQCSEDTDIRKSIIYIRRVYKILRTTFADYSPDLSVSYVHA